MSKKLIIFGQINKKYLLPFFFFFFEIILSIINGYFLLKENHFLFKLFDGGLGQMSVRLLPIIFKISNKNNDKDNLIIKNKFLQYFLICLFLFLTITIRVIGDYIIDRLTKEDGIYNDNNVFLKTDFIVLSFGMTFLVCITICLLKYKYYKHHIISMIIFLIFGVISDIALDNYGEINGYFFLIKFIKIVEIIIESFYICYQKYMMEKLYFPYWSVSFVQGCFVFCIASVLLIVILINPDKEKSSLEFISKFYLYFDNDINSIIVKEIVQLFLYIFSSTLTILILYNFVPNFIYIITQLTYISQNIMEKSSDKLYCIVFYFIQFIALMIHLEILELNFCGLNKYTRRNIHLRGILDLKGEDTDSAADFDYIEINDDYRINKAEKNDNFTEMGENTLLSSIN